MDLLSATNTNTNPTLTQNTHRTPSTPPPHNHPPKKNGGDPCGSKYNDDPHAATNPSSNGLSELKKRVAAKVKAQEEADRLAKAAGLFASVGEAAAGWAVRHVPNQLQAAPDAPYPAKDSVSVESVSWAFNISPPPPRHPTTTSPSHHLTILTPLGCRRTCDADDVGGIRAHAARGPQGGARELGLG